MTATHMNDYLANDFPGSEPKRFQAAAHEALHRHSARGPILYLPTTEITMPEWLQQHKDHLHWIHTLSAGKRNGLSLLDLQDMMARVEIVRMFPHHIALEINMTLIGLFKKSCVAGMRARFNKTPTREVITAFQSNHPHILPQEIQRAAALKIHAVIDEEACNKVAPITWGNYPIPNLGIKKLDVNSQIVPPNTKPAVLPQASRFSHPSTHRLSSHSALDRHAAH
jgi:hypothetical protein